MTPPPDVVVVGAGIAGLTVSLALARRDHRVVLIGDERPGAASRASAGMLAPSLGSPPHTLAAALAARDCYPTFVAALAEITGIVVPLDRRGIIEVAAGDSAVRALHARSAPSAERLDADALAAMEPLLAHHGGAVLHPYDGAVDTGHLLDALERAVEVSPRVTQVRGTVTGVEAGGGSAWVRMADGAAQAGARVVVAGGAWAARLPGLPRPLPVRPVHGQLLLMTGPAPGHVVYGPDGYLIPRGTTVLVGATSAEAGFMADVTEDGRYALCAAARRMAPALGDASVIAHWAGLRPVTPDGLPLLGTDPGHPAIAYACGYSRNGILFAPWAAERLADELTGGRVAELDAFRVERFSASRGSPEGRR